MTTASPYHRTTRRPAGPEPGPEIGAEETGVYPRPDAHPPPDAHPRPGAHSLLVDADEFHAAIIPAIRNARRRVLIQVMTFELDGVGSRLWQTLAASPAAEKILCVDAFSRIKISDAFVFGRRWWTDAARRAEARRTRSLLRPGIVDGVRIVVTNPLGALLHRYPHRNHKKMMIIDDTAFLGGINFSDHNYAWHDLMLQTTDPALVSALAQDFQTTVAGGNASAIHPVPGGRLYLLDGRRSRDAYASLFDEITAARHSVAVISPYLTNPLLARLLALPPSVRTLIINPARNNKPLLRQSLLAATKTAGSGARSSTGTGSGSGACSGTGSDAHSGTGTGTGTDYGYDFDSGSGVAVRIYQPRMSHLKAALVDGERLILGSYNFDYIGSELQQEIMLSLTDPALVADFCVRVLQPDLADSRPAESAATHAWSYAPARWVVRAGEAGAQAVGRLWG